ncbi:MAG: VOC family protein [Deltaproteobacteria bacterium]|nr:VOC family protein [Deltaproteobacteria bacterium]
MSVSKQHHVALTVKDLERSVRFYTRELGLIHDDTLALDEPSAYRMFGIVGVTVRSALLFTSRGDRIDLYQFSSGRNSRAELQFDRPGFQHLALGVEDLEDLGKRLELNGVEVVTAPFQTPTGEKIAFVRDPDGVVLQLIEENRWTARLARIALPARLWLGRSRRRRAHALVGTAMSRTNLPPESPPPVR